MSPADIQALRRALSCSIGELARALGVEAKEVVQWESGERFPTKKHVDLMQKLGARGPDAIARAPKAKPAAQGDLSRLADPKFWEVARKLARHPELFSAVAKLAEAYDDPTPPNC